MIKIVLYLGFISASTNMESFPYFRLAKNVEIYQQIKEGEFITFNSLQDHTPTSLPIEGRVTKVLNDAEANTRYLYILVPEYDIGKVVADKRWEPVLEGNP